MRGKVMNKKALLFGLMFAMMILPLVVAADTVTLTRPAQDASVSGASYVLNATLDSNTLNLTLATFFYDDGSSNTTINANVSNVTDTLFNTTWDSTGIVDVDNLTFWINVTNETYVTKTSDASTGVDVDNGNPTATLSSSTFSDNLHLVTSTTFTVGIDADATIGISSCKIYYTNVDTSAVTSQVVSASGNACSASTTPTAQSLAINQDYTVLIEATDGNGDATNSSSRTLVVTPASVGGTGGSSGSSSSNNGDSGTSGSDTTQPQEGKSFLEWIWYIVSFKWIWG